ncbi:hypothetical protein BZG36_00692 [Bifiguratus adelaidae]|uniref:Homeobox domain-containing protein n=1 Tax=Bifiguratus adelaidae TaxID=1938954 RepID=A0A261Y6W3_9FUNG|nr:hypothetical protein BZG36_00692 [Bifiguratus adelaidae]
MIEAQDTRRPSVLAISSLLCEPNNDATTPQSPQTKTSHPERSYYFSNNQTCKDTEGSDSTSDSPRPSHFFEGDTTTITTALTTPTTSVFGDADAQDKLRQARVSTSHGRRSFDSTSQQSHYHDSMSTSSAQAYAQEMSPVKRTRASDGQVVLPSRIDRDGIFSRPPTQRTFSTSNHTTPTADLSQYHTSPAGPYTPRPHTSFHPPAGLELKTEHLPNFPSHIPLHRPQQDPFAHLRVSGESVHTLDKAPYHTFKSPIPMDKPSLHHDMSSRNDHPLPGRQMASSPILSHNFSRFQDEQRRIPPKFPAHMLRDTKEPPPMRYPAEVEEYRYARSGPSSERDQRPKAPYPPCKVDQRSISADPYPYGQHAEHYQPRTAPYQRPEQPVYAHAHALPRDMSSTLPPLPKVRYERHATTPPSTPPQSFTPHASTSTRTPPAVKPKRKRATASQLQVLNRVFAQTFFPSTELRIQLGKELGMNPRTVQIWFQNKRQSFKSSKLHGGNSEHHSDADLERPDDENAMEGNDAQHSNHPRRRTMSPKEEAMSRQRPGAPLSAILETDPNHSDNDAMETDDVSH